MHLPAQRSQLPGINNRTNSFDSVGQMPSLGFYLRHVRNIEMSHVELAALTPDSRPAFYLEDVNRADFFAITAPKTAGSNFALHNVKDLRIGWSRAAADTVLDSADGKNV